MFIPNYHRNTLINTNHVVRFYIDPPRNERSNWEVRAWVDTGYSEPVERGTEDDCIAFLQYLYKTC